MDRTRDRQPYHPPQITRVVLRQEQAILSQCSTLATGPRDMGSGREQSCAHTGDDCRRWDSTGPFADSGAPPS